MTPDLQRTGVALVLLAVSTSVVDAASGRMPPPPQAVVQVPIVSKDTATQRSIEAQLAAAAAIRLAPGARIGGLNITGRPLKEILDAIAQAGGITVRYASDVAGLGTPVSVTLSDQTVEDALRATLEGRALAFQAVGTKTAFIYPDTPAHREKYTATVRVFPIAKADVMLLTQELNRTLKPTADGFRPMILTVRDPPALVVRAVPELMTGIAAWIAKNDRDQPRGE